MGIASFFHDDALEFRDNFTGSDRERRFLDQEIASDAARLSKIMAEQYGDTERRLSSDLESVLRICDEGDGAVDDIVEDLRNGDITATEAAAQLGAARRDLNRIRKLAHEAEGTEDRAWSEVNVSPGEYQRSIERRFPALFKNGRGLLTLPTPDAD